MPAISDRETPQFADMLAALGAEPRLRIIRLLVTAHPKGLIAGEIGEALDITPSTLSHHLDRLKREHVITVRRQGTYLWYTVNADALERLLRFLQTSLAVPQF